MTSERVLYSPAQVRAFVEGYEGDVSASPFFRMVAHEEATPHIVHPAIAAEMAQEIIGLDTMVAFFRHPGAGSLVTRIFEEHGWGRTPLRPQDLQMNLLNNLVKYVVMRDDLIKSRPKHDIHGKILETMDAVNITHEEIREAVIDTLILKEGFSMPWLILVHLSECGSHACGRLPSDVTSVHE